MRWPERLWLLSSLGELVRGRCKSTNLCDYCAKLAAVENTEMLALDAMEGNAPRVWMVLTTRTATLDMADFYMARQLLIRAIRREFPGTEYASLLEFTRGYARTSGGKRRPHWNVLLKGVPPEAIERLRELVADYWCGNVDAEPVGQHVGEISEAGGLMRYIALHFQKESQSPPKGFRGQRFNCSRGYFTDRTRAEAREAAKESLWLKRQLHKAAKLGLEGEAAEDWIDDQLAAQGLPEWGLWVEPNRPVQPADPGDLPDLAVCVAATVWAENPHQDGEAVRSVLYPLDELVEDGTGDAEHPHGDASDVEDRPSDRVDTGLHLETPGGGGEVEAHRLDVAAVQLGRHGSVEPGAVVPLDGQDQSPCRVVRDPDGVPAAGAVGGRHTPSSTRSRSSASASLHASS